MRAIILTSVVGSLLAFAPLRGQQSQLGPWFATVKLDVTGSIDDTSQVIAWYSEELRRMQGVRVSDSAESWNISLILMKNENQRGVATGYTLSEVILERYDPTWFFKLMAQRDTTAGGRSAFLMAAAFTEPSWRMVHNSVNLTGPDGLRSAVEDLAAKFDAEQLEPSRKAWDKAQLPKPK